MTDVFVCYKREDESRVAGIVEGLRHGGLPVAWDRDIPTGANWRQTLLDHLDSAKCVVVVWTETSVGPAGEFVQDEASRAKARGVLLPVRLDDVDGPLGFGQTQWLDLIGWDGTVEDDRFRGLIAAVRRMIGAEPHLPPQARASSRPGPEDRLARLATVIPAYLSDLLNLTSGPKRFLAERLASGESPWQEALRFFALSFVLTFAISLPLASSNLPREFASDTPFVIAYVVLFGYVTWAAWRLVGAKTPIQDLFAAHLYLAGVLKLMMTATFVVTMGVLRSGDRALYERLTTLASRGEVLNLVPHVEELVKQHPTFRLVELLALGGFVAMLVWVLVAWGAYRALADVGRLRSLAAFLLFGLLCLPVLFMTFFAANALMR